MQRSGGFLFVVLTVVGMGGGLMRTLYNVELLPACTFAASVGALVLAARAFEDSLLFQRAMDVQNEQVALILRCEDGRFSNVAAIPRHRLSMSEVESILRTISRIPSDLPLEGLTPDFVRSLQEASEGEGTELVLKLTAAEWTQVKVHPAAQQ